MAVLLGYGLLLVVNLQVFAQQRYQRQLDIMRRAERVVLRSSAEQVDAQTLQRTLSHFSTFDLALWGHPEGFPAGMVMPQLSSNDLIVSTPALRFQAEEQVRRTSRPQTFEAEGRTYMVSGTTLSLGKTPWSLYLLKDVSEDVALQRQLNGILTAAALLASLLTLIINRRGIQRSLLPLRRFGETLSAVRSSSLQQQRFTPGQEPDELQPLAHAFNELLDRLAQSFERQRQFASTVSHELRNPITLIAGYSRRLLRRSHNLSEEQRHQLAIVEEESRRLGRLVTGLLAHHASRNRQSSTRAPTLERLRGGAAGHCPGRGGRRTPVSLLPSRRHRSPQPAGLGGSRPGGAVPRESDRECLQVQPRSHTG